MLRINDNFEVRYHNKVNAASKMTIIFKWHMCPKCKGAIKCFKMERLKVNLPRDFSVDLTIQAQLVVYSDVISAVFSFFVCLIKLTNIQLSKKKVLKYKFDQSTLNDNGHLNLPLFLEKQQSGRLFYLSLISRRWDLGHPGLLPPMLLPPLATQC